MATNWQHLQSSIPVPKDTEYRESLKLIHCDNKLHFFSLKGVDPTSENWHETMLQGSHVTTYDLEKKVWLEANKMNPVDTDDKHREYLFSVGKHILAFVYSVVGSYHKLLQFKDNGLDREIKIDTLQACPGAGCDKDKSEHNIAHKFFATDDGFYVAWETNMVHVARLIVENDSSGTEIKGARCRLVAQFDVRKYFPMGGHMTDLAYSSDHKKLVLWGGQQGCGFRWQPRKIFVAQLEEGKVTDAVPAPDVPEPVPPYAGSGASETIQVGKLLILLGGSTMTGMTQCKDNKEIWSFDVDGHHFRKSTKFELPDKITLYRTSFAFDWTHCQLFVCDSDQGIYSTSLMNFS